MKNREEWLCEQLDRNDLSDTLRESYERELDSFADRFTKVQVKMKQNEEKERARLADIRAKILANDDDFVQAFGDTEFGSDYELVQEGDQYVVYSKVARDDQDHRRVHETYEKAYADRRWLYWNRLYTKYVRTGELDHLSGLTG